ncbi:MAG TPA: class I SAM-dependent methyltransferase, partial [Flavobacteriaceae bacterium]|nr:class I SAM-dependent methyltransferase [Flavobacteriaceae bacterium]
KCFYDKTNHKAYVQLKAYRERLLSNKEKITITDLGAGSKRFKTMERSIKAIAKTSGTPLKRVELLFRIVNYFKPQHILELGTSLGIATQAMALGNKKATVTSIEGSPDLSAVARQQLDTFNIENAILKTGRFEAQLPTLAQQTWDLVFFDGNHQKEATLHYFEQLLPTVHNDSIFILDDIYWSKGMTEAWQTIKQHPKVATTLDSFYWGVVFFKKELSKENFKIRV